MPPTKVDLLMFGVLLTLFFFPLYDKYIPRTKFWNETLPNFLLYFGLPILAFLITFIRAGIFKPNNVMFSSDGPYGIYEASWFKEGYTKGPGTPMWNDLSWIGFDNDQIPFNFSYILLWLFCHPWYLIGFICLLNLAHWLVTKPKTAAPKFPNDNVWKDRFKGWK